MEYFSREGFLRSALYLHLFEISVSNADNENRQWQVWCPYNTIFCFLDVTENSILQKGSDKWCFEPTEVMCRNLSIWLRTVIMRRTKYLLFEYWRDWLAISAALLITGPNIVVQQGKHCKEKRCMLTLCLQLQPPVFINQTLTSMMIGKFKHHH